MPDSPQDIWSQWLLNRRFGGDPQLMKKMLECLYPVRNKVLSHIDLGDGETLADDLLMLSDESVDAVTTRSVLIYVPAKGQAFREFHRVLKAGGQVSIFEPINAVAYLWAVK